MTYKKKITTAKSELIIHALGGTTNINQKSRAGNVHQEINNSAPAEMTSMETENKK
jgi:hypothetical protein